MQTATAMAQVKDLNAVTDARRHDLMDADGNNVQRLTFEGEIVADSQWSPDGRRITFRQQQPRLFGAGRIRVLTFDDCD